MQIVPGSHLLFYNDDVVVKVPVTKSFFVNPHSEVAVLLPDSTVMEGPLTWRNVDEWKADQRRWAQTEGSLPLLSHKEEMWFREIYFRATGKVLTVSGD
jgi:hypothetical protein